MRCTHPSRSPAPPAPRTPAPPRESGQLRSFTLIEILVVIGIIALLAGILLVALKGALSKAKQTETLATMEAVKAACEAYRQEHGEYPGVIPEAVLAQAIIVAAPGARITGTENLMLALLGGYRLITPGDGPDVATNQNPNVQDYRSFNGQVVFTYSPVTGQEPWKLKVNRTKIGEGPVINGKQYQPYLTLKDRELRELPHLPFPPAGGATGTGSTGNVLLPEIADAWGQPLGYLRRISPTGPLVNSTTGAAVRPQFSVGGIFPYITSTALGDLGKSQLLIGTTPRGSILNTTGNVVAGVTFADATLAQILRHTSFGNPVLATGTAAAEIAQMTGRGDFVLISAGPDGVYFSAIDGPGSPGAFVDNIVTDPDHSGPQVVEDYDDIRVFGGGGG